MGFRRGFRISSGIWDGNLEFRLGIWDQVWDLGWEFASILLGIPKSRFFWHFPGVKPGNVWIWDGNLGFRIRFGIWDGKFEIWEGNLGLRMRKFGNLGFRMDLGLGIWDQGWDLGREINPT